MMSKALIEKMWKHKDQITQFGVLRLAMFGPVARGEPIYSGGEIHLLVELEGVMTFERFVELRDFLSTVLGFPVELVVEKRDHPLIWAYVKDDLVDVL